MESWAATAVTLVGGVDVTLRPEDGEVKIDGDGLPHNRLIATADTVLPGARR